MAYMCIDSAYDDRRNVPERSLLDLFELTSQKYSGMRHRNGNGELRDETAREVLSEVGSQQERNEREGTEGAGDDVDRDRARDLLPTPRTAARSAR
jgi:hypothetical protein